MWQIRKLNRGDIEAQCIKSVRGSECVHLPYEQALGLLYINPVCIVKKCVCVLRECVCAGARGRMCAHVCVSRAPCCKLHLFLITEC